eukprot:scaffold37109_cov63-Phaeocystis_antarctica.AAC.2
MRNAVHNVPNGAEKDQRLQCGHDGGRVVLSLAVQAGPDPHRRQAVGNAIDAEHVTHQRAADLRTSGALHLRAAVLQVMHVRLAQRSVPGGDGAVDGHDDKCDQLEKKQEYQQERRNKKKQAGRNIALQGANGN